MKKHINKLLLYSLVVGLSVIIVFAIQLLTKQKREETVFSTDCNAPCWRYIIPGKTTIQEAYNLVSNFPDKESSHIEYSPALQSIIDSYISFNLSNGIKVEMYAVNDIVILIAFYDDNGITTFGKCISEFGPPEIAGQSYYWSYGLPILPTQAKHILFVALSPQKGIAYTYDTYTYLGTKQNVSPESIISEIDYFDSKYYDDLLQDGRLVFSEAGHKKNVLYPWIGFGNIFELYPSEN